MQLTGDQHPDARLNIYSHERAYALGSIEILRGHLQRDHGLSEREYRYVEGMMHRDAHALRANEH